MENNSKKLEIPVWGKIIVISGPSGTGKTTLRKHLQKAKQHLEFSVSSTSRRPRGSELNGVDYTFLTNNEFRKKIEADEFVEFEEVYYDTFYGTPKSELLRIFNNFNTPLLDIDVKGALRLKEIFGEKVVTIFVETPIKDLWWRLANREDTPLEKVDERVAKAEIELREKNKFDFVLMNDVLDIAKQSISEFVGLILLEVESIQDTQEI